MLSIRNLNLAYGSKTVLHGFSMETQSGEIACLLGASGCGKTTVLRSIAGFEMPQSGSIVLNGRSLDNIAPHRRRIGMVFQDYALFPHLNVAQNIAFGLHKQSETHKRQRVAELLDLIGLNECGRRYPHELSGGQQQRVALARALAPGPDLVLLDEPFSNLDAQMRTRLAKEVRTLLKQAGVGAVMVTHDRHEAFAVADKIGVMIAGSLKQWDTPQQVYCYPADAETALLTGAGSILDGQVSGSLIRTAAGSFPHAGLPGCANVRVLLRPHHVRPDAALPPTATLTGCVFDGAVYACTLQLDSGENLSAQIPADQTPPPPGSRCGIYWDAARVCAWPV